MHLVSIKTLIRSYLPSLNLVHEPFENQEYLSLWKKHQIEMNDSVHAKNLSKATVEWIDNLALKTSVSVKKSTPNWVHGYLIYSVIQQFCQNSSKEQVTYFETGTAKGFSALVAVKAIIDCNKIPVVVTIDILNDNKKRYWNAIGDIHGPRTRAELLLSYESFLPYVTFLKLRSQQLKSLKFANIIDVGFIDGAHNYKLVKKDFHFIRKYLDTKSQIIFDDVDSRKFPGIVKLIEKLKFTHQIDHIDSISGSRGYAILKNSD